jgi:hypothetical protein
LIGVGYDSPVRACIHACMAGVACCLLDIFDDVDVDVDGNDVLGRLGTVVHHRAYMLTYASHERGGEREWE